MPRLSFKAFSFLKHFKISQRIAALVALSILSTLGLIGATFTGNILNDRAFWAMEKNNEMLTLVKDFEINVLHMMQNEKVYLAAPLKSYVEQFEFEFVNGRSNLAKLEKLDVSSTVRDEITALNQTVKSYKDAFDQTVATQQAIGTSQKAGLTAELKKLADDVEKAIFASHQNKLIISLLSLRRLEQSYFLTKDEAHLTAFAAESMNFEKSLKYAMLSPSKKETCCQRSAPIKIALPYGPISIGKYSLWRKPCQICTWIWNLIHKH